MEDGWQEEPLRFWFDELKPAEWWMGGAGTDEKVRPFATLHDAVAAADVDELTHGPREALAAVIALDQFPRNLFRGTARAFATDARALAVTKVAIAKGLDRGLDATQRQFLYMPFMHSENAEDLRRCVELFATLGNEQSLDAALEHQRIIAQFGRYPHRNRILGRTSTPEEEAFLAGHRGFGQ